MKALFIIIAMTDLSYSCLAQNIQQPDADYYLKKSKDQKTAAYVTLGCGAATLVPGLIMVSQTGPGWETVNWTKALGGSGLIILGTGCLVASLVLFIQSDKNQRKVNSVTLQLNKAVPVNTGLQKITLPYSIGLSVALR